MIDAMNDDMLSLSMFWAGLLMVFAPLVGAGTVLGCWWRWRVRVSRGEETDARRRVPESEARQTSPTRD
jgi:hypothetical protein